MQAYEVGTVSRAYRQNFSQAYKVLYKEGELSYLTEILDSAQEGTGAEIQVPVSPCRLPLSVGQRREIFLLSGGLGPRQSTHD
jgi:hypothetical protein